MNLLGAVTAKDDRFLTHRRDEEVAGVWDLALVPDKQPGAGEDAFQFLLVDLGGRRLGATTLTRSPRRDARAADDPG